MSDLVVPEVQFWLQNSRYTFLELAAPMDKELEEKNSLQHLLVSGTLSKRDGVVETMIEGTEENLGPDGWQTRV